MSSPLSEATRILPSSAQGEIMNGEWGRPQGKCSEAGALRQILNTVRPVRRGEIDAHDPVWRREPDGTGLILKDPIHGS